MDQLDKMLFDLGQEKEEPSLALVNLVKHQVRLEKRDHKMVYLLIAMICVTGAISSLLFYLMPLSFYFKLGIGMMIWGLTLLVQIILVINKRKLIQIVNRIL